jgi:hypothetical protein
MAEKVYNERLPSISERTLRVEVKQCRGRYWHMKDAHATMEDYWPPEFPG